MISAFGVDHGEISKARMIRLRAPKTAPGGKRPTRAQVRTQATAPAPTRPERLKNTANKIGEADISLKGIGSSTGKGVRSVGNWFERHPGLTGTALVGGGSVGGYKYLSNKEPRRKEAP